MSSADVTPPAWPARPDAAPADTIPWWTDRVFHEVFVRSFADSDDDGIGDLAGLTARLDELNDGDPATTTDALACRPWPDPDRQRATVV